MSAPRPRRRCFPISRKDQVQKWLLYGLALLPIFLVQSVVFGRVSFWGVRPNLLPLAVSVVAVKEGPSAGAGYGLYTGLFATLMIPASMGVYIFLLSCLGAFAGALFRRGVQQTFWGCLLCAAGSLFSLSLFQIMYFLLIGGRSALSLFPLAGQELFWSLVLFPLVYGLYVLVYRRVGGLKLM